MFSVDKQSILEKTEDACNKIAKSTRTQLKSKAYASRSYVKRYLKYLNDLQQNNYDDAQWT